MLGLGGGWVRTLSSIVSSDDDFSVAAVGPPPRRVGGPLNRLKRPELITQAPRHGRQDEKMQTGLSG